MRCLGIPHTAYFVERDADRGRNGALGRSSRFQKQEEEAGNLSWRSYEDMVRERRQQEDVTKTSRDRPPKKDYHGLLEIYQGLLDGELLLYSA